MAYIPNPLVHVAGEITQAIDMGIEDTPTLIAVFGEVALEWVSVIRKHRGLSGADVDVVCFCCGMVVCTGY